MWIVQNELTLYIESKKLFFMDSKFDEAFV